MVAYACDPAGGGEHWLGWGWASEMSRDHDIVLFTTSRGGDALLAAVAERGIEVHCIDVPRWVRWLSGFPPGLGTWFRKFWWQGMALKKARRLHARIPFDLVHQTTFHTFRVPFSCAKLGIPSVWGPIAGGERVPPGFEKYLGAAAKWEKFRAFVNHLNLGFPWVRTSLRNSSRIVVSNRTTLGFLPTEFHEKCVVISPNALREEDMVTPAPRQKSEIFKMLFVGNCAPTRAMPLIFEAVAANFPVEWRMKVVGAGTALDFWREETARLKIADRVEFTGPIPREILQKIYQESSALVFPALRDSGGSALLEAMTLGLPILTFDWGGPGEIIDRDSAILVKPDTPEQTIADIRFGLLDLATHPDRAALLATSARRRALQLFRWQDKARIITLLYGEVIKQSNSSVVLESIQEGYN